MLIIEVEGNAEEIATELAWLNDMVSQAGATSSVWLKLCQR